MTVALFRRKKWNPRRLGSSLAAWYKADAGCYTDAACLFASASSMYASNSSASIAVGSGDAYWAGWVYLTTDTGNPAFFGKYGAALDLGFIVWYQSGVGFTIDASDDGVAAVEAVDATTRATGTWHFVEAKYTRSTKKVGIAVNGGAFTESAAMPTAGIFVSSRAFSVGRNDGGLGYLNGAAARLGMWARLPTAGERTSLYNAGAGKFYADLTTAEKVSLVEYWNLCESSSTRVGSHAGLNLTPTNGPTVAAGPGEGACVNGSPCKRAEDQSGNARHLEQATITAQPIWTAAFQNGRPALVFDDVDDYLTCAGFTFSQPCAYGVSGGSTATGYMIDADSPQSGRVFENQGATALRMYAPVTVFDSTVSALSTFRSYVALYNGASSVLSQDGVETTGTVGAGNGTGVRVGAAGDAAVAFAQLNLGELVLATGAMSAAVRTSLHGYQKARWSTP